LSKQRVDKNLDSFSLKNKVSENIASNSKKEEETETQKKMGEVIEKKIKNAH